MSQSIIYAKPGATSVTTDVLLLQNAGSTAAGDPILGLVYNTTNLICYYRLPPTGSATSQALATQTVGGAFSSGGFVQIDSTHMPGLYRIDLPNALFTNAGEANVMLAGAAAGTAGTLEPHLIKCIVGDAMGIRTTAMVESYPAIGAAPTLEQYCFMTMQRNAPTKRTVIGTTETVYKLDGVTVAYTFTLDLAANPTTYTRAT